MLQEYLKSFKSLWSLGVVAAASGPLALTFPELTPPWPTNSARIATIFSALAVILALVLGRELATHRKSAPNRDRRVTAVGSACVFIGLAGCFVYLTAYSKYVVVVTQPTVQGERHLRFVVGTEKLDPNSSPGTPEGLLQNNMYEPERIWTSESLAHTRLFLFGSFALTFSILTFGLGLLAMAVGHVGKYSRGRSGGSAS